MGEVPAWVPLVVAFFGFVGVIAAQVLAGRRDDRRWRREREHEREVRTREERAHSYTEVLGVIEAYDWALYRGRKMLEQGRPLDEHLADELREATRSAGRALGAINLHGPESIRSRLRDTMLPRSRLATKLLDATYQPEDKQLWEESKSEYQHMRTLMRADLGLDPPSSAAPQRRR